MRKWNRLVALFLISCIFSGCQLLPHEEQSQPIQPVESVEVDIPEVEEEMSYGTYYYSQGENASLNWPMKDNCLVEPILQNPGPDSVIVQWFTEEPGTKHFVQLYENGIEAGVTRTVDANTIQLSRIRGGKTEKDCDDSSIEEPMYKHVAIVEGLPEYHGNIEERVPYNIVSDNQMSAKYTLSAAPAKDTPVRVLLTSDLQIKTMCAANIQKVFETVGHVDAIFLNGDIAEVADRKYDWFYADNAFFRVMTGTANNEINGQVYKGAPFLQSCPIYTAIGNHDVMGVYDNEYSLVEQFNIPATRTHAEALLALSSQVLSMEDREQFIVDHSFNTISYEEMFELPTSKTGGERYYTTSFGDIQLISLEVARIWRLPTVDGIGAYSEDAGSDEFKNLYGFGSFIFEPIDIESKQVQFLTEAVNSEEYQTAKYKMCMFHSEAHSVGANQIPPFTDPVASTIQDPVAKKKKKMIYDYPIGNDYINTVVEPILESAGTNLLFEGHSHLWNRFETANGMNVLESSNVGNNYGGFMEGEERGNMPSCFDKKSKYYKVRDSWNIENYVATGDPYGLEPVYPTVQSLPDEKPYLASDTITAFSILDTCTGLVNSYYFDTEKADSDVVMFDSFFVE